MQLLLHLGQLLLQSGELWTQGRATGYHGETMGFCHHYDPPKLLSHHCTGMLGYDYTQTHMYTEISILLGKDARLCSLWQQLHESKSDDINIYQAWSGERCNYSDV